MEKPKNVVLPPQDDGAGTEAGMSRRRLLKAVAAGGAAAALAFVPHRWSKPVVEAGQLAAHAETSPASLRISDLSLACSRVRSGVDTADGYLDCAGELCYDDPLGQVAINTLVIKGHFTKGPCDDTNGASSSNGCPNIELDLEFEFDEWKLGSTGYKGCFTFKSLTNSTSAAMAETSSGCCIDRCIWIEVNGRKSNPLCDQLTYRA